MSGFTIDWLQIVIGGIFGFLLTAGGEEALRRLRAMSGKLSGRWIGTIAATDREGEKTHALKLRQIGAHVTGTIERHRGPQEVGKPPRKWRLHGHLHGDTLIAVYWGASDGVMLLRQERSDDTFRGRYTSIDEAIGPGGKISGELQTIDVHMIKA